MALTTKVFIGTSLKFLLYHLCSQQVLSQKVDWCTLSCGSTKNTLCAYRPKKNAGDCKNIEMATTNSVRKDLLDLHNAYRNKIAAGQVEEKGEKWPIAGDMRQMSWDNDLEKLAYRWVQQCSDNPAHDSCRRTPAFEYNGQNKAYQAGGSYASPNVSFQAWIDEISLTTPSIRDPFDFGTDGKWAHFTQVIWAATYKLGCSAIHADKRGLLATIVVCNYGPGGNIGGDKIYTKGAAACDKCPSGTQCKSDSAYTNLCALPSDDIAPKDIDAPPDINDASSELRIFGMNPKDSPISFTASFSALLTSLAMNIY